MTTKELIYAEIDRLPDEVLGDLYNLIKNFAESQPREDKRSFMSKLLTIQIDAPEDFAANQDDYMYGDKDGNTGLH